MKKLFIALFSVALFFSCSKDEHLLQDNLTSPLTYRQNIPAQNHTFDQHPDTLKQTLLGAELNNPFTVTNMLNALESLCGYADTSIIRIIATDKQVKFMPRDFEELKKLFRDTSLILFDFPLKREVIEMGDYYIDPELEGDIPDFYTIVKEDHQLPEGIPYDIIEEYAYVFDNLLLIAESFRLTDNFEYVNDYIFPDNFGGTDSIEICGLIIPPVIECPPGCVPILVLDDFQMGSRPVYKWECDCNPDNGGGGSGLSNNDCGCSVYSDQRKPGGCINVENNSITNLEGVNKVKVIVKDYRYGKAYKTWTDSEGCWKINKGFKGRMWMWVEFINSDSYERCYKSNWEVWELLKPVKDYVGHMWGPNFNDVEVIYWHWGDETGTQAQRYWGAATINNEVQIYLDETSDIDRPPSLLDIYLQPNERSGAAIMGSHWPGAILSLIPDLSIGIDFPDRNWQDRLSYHEIAHASHFSQTGFGWWSHLMAQEIANSIVVNGNTFNFSGDPHGQGNEPDAGYVALAESWADNVSTDITLDTQEGELFENGYIPTGLYHDLEDDTQNEIIRLGIFDRVNGYTRGVMFNSLNSNVTTLNQYQQDLQGFLPSGNTLAEYNNLFTAYTP